MLITQTTVSTYVEAWTKNSAGTEYILRDHFHVAQRGLASLHEASVVCACSY